MLDPEPLELERELELELDLELEPDCWLSELELDRDRCLVLCFFLCNVNGWAPGPPTPPFTGLLLLTRRFESHLSLEL